MGSVAVAAGLQTALSPSPRPTETVAERLGASVDPAPIATRPADRSRVATADFAGHVLPLPALDELWPTPGGSPDTMLAGSTQPVPPSTDRSTAAPLAALPAPLPWNLAVSGAAPLPADDPAVAPVDWTPGELAPIDLAPAALTPDDRSTGDWLALPDGAEATPVLEAEHLVVQRGDTLLQILLRSGIDRAEAHEVVGTLSTLYDPRRLRVGQAMAVEVERAGDALAAPRLAALSLNLDFGNDLRVERDANGDFAARKVDRELVQTVHAAHAVIDTSLYQTARRHSVPDEALVNLANIFSWDLDFQRDVHPGDSFELVYEQVESPDGEVRGGDVLFASLKLRGRQIHAYRYQHTDGTTGYYDIDGRSLRKWLMRTPIDGARLSSGFGPRRHPILGYNRMHRGVDFAAPTGTPIFAAGDGVITRIGRNGAYGNYIQIRHNGEFSTAYAHMSRFADGLKNGSRVRQGQVIAYVGSTGRSTGPHLHYEVLERGQQINPMSIKPQTAARLAGADLERFRRQIETIDAKRPTSGDATTLAQR